MPDPARHTVPRAFEAAIANDNVHTLQHASFLVTASFWRATLAPYLIAGLMVLAGVLGGAPRAAVPCATASPPRGA